LGAKHFPDFSFESNRPHRAWHARRDLHVIGAETKNHLRTHRIASRYRNALAADRNSRYRTVRGFNNAGEAIFNATMPATRSLPDDGNFSASQLHKRPRSSATWRAKASWRSGANTITPDPSRFDESLNQASLGDPIRERFIEAGNQDRTGARAESLRVGRIEFAPALG
jgi:hypothetical protein